MNFRESMIHARGIDFIDLRLLVLTFVASDMKARLKMADEFFEKYTLLEEEIKETNNIVLLANNLRKLQEIRATFHGILTYLIEDYTEHTLESYINLIEDEGDDRQVFLDMLQEQQIQWNISCKKVLEKECWLLEEKLFDAKADIRFNKYLIIALIILLTLLLGGCFRFLWLSCCW